MYKITWDGAYEYCLCNGEYADLEWCKKEFGTDHEIRVSENDDIYAFDHKNKILMIYTDKSIDNVVTESSVFKTFIRPYNQAVIDYPKIDKLIEFFKAIQGSYE